MSDKDTGLISTQEAWNDTKSILDSLVERQATDGERAGSFHPDRANTAGYEYTAPLALIAATERPEISAEDKKKYLGSAKQWLTFTYNEQRDDGLIKSSSVANPNNPETEATLGALWVASRYKQATDKEPNRAELQAISKDNPEALTTLADRASTAMEGLQEMRADHLFPATTGYIPSYYFINVHAHGSLLAAEDCFGAESDIGKRCAAMNDKLIQPLREFSDDKHPHTAFMKAGTEPDAFSQYPGHELPADGYSGVVAGQNKHLESAQKELEAAMSDPEKKKSYYAIQTLPFASIMGLSAAGVKTIKINDHDASLEEVMADQVKVMKPGSDTPHAQYVHTLGGVCLTACQGHEWMAPPVRAKEQPAKQEKIDKPPVEEVDMNDVSAPMKLPPKPVGKNSTTPSFP